MQDQVQQATEILKKGGLVAYPTDTVYGLGADCRNEAAVARVFDVKKRPRSLALPLLLAGVSQMESVAESVPEIAWCLAQRFWPGGLTLVVHKAAWVSSLISGGGNRVAVRVPDHPVPVALIRGLGAPITGTSANITGRPSPVTAGEVCDEIGYKIGLVIDGGRCLGGVESTVLDVTERVPRILRLGVIPKAEIEKVCATAQSPNQKGALRE